MKFNCRSCGHPIEVTPPDKDHVIILSKACPNGDSIGARAQCKDCQGWTEIYWDEEHELAR